MNYKVIEPEDNYSFFYVWTWEDDAAYEQAKLRVGTFFAKPPTDEQIARLIANAEEYLITRKARDAAEDSSAEDR